MVLRSLNRDLEVLKSILFFFQKLAPSGCSDTMCTRVCFRAETMTSLISQSENHHSQLISKYSSKKPLAFCV